MAIVSGNCKSYSKITLLGIGPDGEKAGGGRKRVWKMESKIAGEKNFVHLLIKSTEAITSMAA